MVSSKKKKKKKKKIQHVRDYRAQGETAGASALARVYSTTVDMTGYFFFFFFFFFVFCILYYYFLFVFFFLFEDTIEKFRLLISKIYTQLT